MRPDGFELVLHRSLTEPILIGGAPRAAAILIGTLSAVLALGLRLWFAGIVLWVIGHSAAVTIRKISVNASNTSDRAISLGVRWRIAPSRSRTPSSIRKAACLT